MKYKCNVSDLPALVREQQALRAGDRVILSGTVYTSRDAAHKRLTAAMKEQGTDALPFPLKDAVIYYAGPTAAPLPSTTRNATPESGSFSVPAMNLRIMRVVDGSS